MLREVPRSLYAAWRDLSAELWPLSAAGRRADRLARLDGRIRRLHGRLRSLTGDETAYARALGRLRALHAEREGLAGRAGCGGRAGAGPATSG